MIVEASSLASPGEAPRTRSSATWKAAAFYVALTIALTWPISLRPDRLVWADDPDGQLVMWLLAWDSHAFVTQPLSIFDANSFFPLRRTLAFQENLIGSAFFAAPVMWVTGNPVLAANVVSMLACVLCGLGAYLLARRLGIGSPGALVCGAIFAFAPPRFLRYPQTHLAAVQWIPFLLASLHAYLDGGRRRDLRLAIAFFTLQVLASGHAGVFAVVAIALLLAHRAALGEPLRPLQRLRDAGLVGALLIVPAVLVLIPYRVNQIELGLRRALEGWDTTNASFLASPTPVHVYLQSLVTDIDINALATAFLFPGVLPVALALAAVGWAVMDLVRLKPDATSASPPDPADAASHWAEAPAAAQASPNARLALTCVTVAAVSCVVLLAARPLLRAGDGLIARYFDNAGWTAPPVSIGADPLPSTARIHQRWNGSPPASFSVTWSGYLSVTEPGLYHFIAPPRGLTIDDRIVVNEEGRGGVQLDRKPHRVVLRSAQPGDGPGLEWAWAREGDSGYQPLPAWALSRAAAAPSAVLAVRAVDAALRVGGFLLVVSAVWWVLAWSARRAQTFGALRHATMTYYVLLTVLCGALAVGPPYGLWQFVYTWPGFNFIRGSSRFMLPALLGVAVLAGMGFDRLIARRSPLLQRALLAAVLALLVAEFAGQTFSSPFEFQLPAADRWLDRQPKPFSIAEVPSSAFQRSQTTFMLHSLAHWQKTVHGYGGILPEFHRMLQRELEWFPDAASLEHLQQAGVTYVVVHIDMYPPDEWKSVEARLAARSDVLTLVYSDPAGRVYALRRKTG